MKVFVTGATGFVGEEVVRQLHAAGHAIRILARQPTSPRVQGAVSEYGAEIHAGNVLDANSLRGGLKDCEALIHLVGIISEIGRNTFENVHTHGTHFLKIKDVALTPHQVEVLKSAKSTIEKLIDLVE